MAGERSFYITERWIFFNDPFINKMPQTSGYRNPVLSFFGRLRIFDVDALVDPATTKRETREIVIYDFPDSLRTTICNLI